MIMSPTKSSESFHANFYIFFIIGFTNYVLPFSLIAFGIDGMSSGLAALLMSAGPFYAIILSHLFTNDKFNKYKLIGTLIGFVSVFILFYDQVYVAKVCLHFSARNPGSVDGSALEKFLKKPPTHLG